eukprot:1185072-Prorocentrum_minimum.AAC.1
MRCTHMVEVRFGGGSAFEHHFVERLGGLPPIERLLRHPVLVGWGTTRPGQSRRANQGAGRSIRLEWEPIRGQGGASACGGSLLGGGEEHPPVAGANQGAGRRGGRGLHLQHEVAREVALSLDSQWHSAAQQAS